MSPGLDIKQEWNGTPLDPREYVHLRLRRGTGALQLEVDSPYYADPAPQAPPGPLWGLWEHEVVELFIGGPGQRYTEIELGPHGHHLVLRLDGVRNPVERELPLVFEARVEGARWRARAELPLAWLPEGPLRGNAYAIHGLGPARRYLAWNAVPGPRPDFHQPHRFLDLPLG